MIRSSIRPSNLSNVYENNTLEKSDKFSIKICYLAESFHWSNYTRKYVTNTGRIVRKILNLFYCSQCSPKLFKLTNLIQCSPSNQFGLKIADVAVSAGRDFCNGLNFLELFFFFFVFFFLFYYSSSCFAGRRNSTMVGYFASHRQGPPSPVTPRASLARVSWHLLDQTRAALAYG